MTDVPTDDWAPPTEAREHFAARLRHETDVSDVAAQIGRSDVVVVDVRSDEAWAAGHLPGAVHLPRARIADAELPEGARVVTYCWGPGCNGATRGALAFAQRGVAVKEMLGGFEYWVREGFEIETADGVRRREPDPLTAPSGVACAC